jgi:class 3 adenylate cyclase/pimeloyl-ACP methyl ester carboxylesterase
MQPQEIHYVKSGGLHIAYDVTGDGAIDIVLVPGLLNTLEAHLAHAPLARFHERLTRFARVIRLDKRGTGLSDRLAPGTAPTIEERIDDVRTVMDAAGSESAALLGVADGGPVTMMFAATYPERVRALVLESTGARFRWAEDHPWAWLPEQLELSLEMIEREWGRGLFAAAMGMDTEEGRRAMGRIERLAGTPSSVALFARAIWETDVRPVLGTIAAPALVVHHTDNVVFPGEGARYLAEHIRDARFVELPGQPESFVDDSGRGAFAELIEEFLTGQRPVPETDRVLKTVLFTDIVSSTARAAELGDRRWKELLDGHDRAVRRVVEEHRGQAVNTTGDGMFAVFDGPARAIACGRAVIDEATRMGLDVRVGVHTGECEQRGDDYAGIAVHIGARVAAAATPGEVLATGTVRDLVAGSGLRFTDRGRHTLKGVPGEWQLLAVV